MGRRRRRGGRNVAEDEEEQDDGFRSRPVMNKELQHGAGLDHRAMYGVAAMQGWRAAMEDAHLALPDFDTDRGLSLFGVFDGHGGAAVAQVAAERLPKLLRSQPAYGLLDYAGAFREAFASLEDLLRSPAGHREVARRSRGETPKGMGCTAVVALIVGAGRDTAAKPGACWPQTGSAGSELLVANLGDSRCVLASGSSAIAMSQDHTPNLPHERLRIKRAGGFVNKEGRVNGNLNLSRALGDFFYKRDRRLKPEEQLISGVPEIRRRKLQSVDKYLVLGCDGVFERMSNEAIVRNLLAELEGKGAKQSGPKALSFACGNLLDKLVSKNPAKTQGLGCDNMTVILVSLHGGRTQQLNLADLLPVVRKRPAAATTTAAATATAAATQTTKHSAAATSSGGSLQKRQKRIRRRCGHLSVVASKARRGKRCLSGRRAVLRAQTAAAHQRRCKVLLAHPSIC